MSSSIKKLSRDFYNVIHINIDIEKIVNAKREKKINFTTTIFEISKEEENTIDNN